VTLAAGGDKTLVLDALTLSGTARLDLTDEKMIVRSTDANRVAELAAISAAIKSGFNLGNGAVWAGAGITSSLGGDGTSNVHALGVALNDLAAAGAGTGAMHTTFGGESVGVNDILVAYTVFGDADLSGAVNSSDYFQIDSGFLAGRTGWINGDFDYDGAVTSNDYFLIDSAFLA
jgi:hypothetical protein